MGTEVGKIASLLKSTSEKRTPLQMNLDDFGKKLSIIILVFCGILFGINVLRGGSAVDAFLFAVSMLSDKPFFSSVILFYRLPLFQ